MDKVECVVIGAGVIGLAIARRLAQAGREVIVLEAAEGIGTVTSSRNSEVIHAGIYYKAGSLMARMCVNGKRALYEYCASHGIPHKNCGKLIVATTRDGNREAAIDPRHMPRPTACSTCRCFPPTPPARWSRRSIAMRRCSRRRPESSTAIPTCWRCGAMRKRPALPLPFTRRCCAPRRRQERSSLTPAARRR